MAENDSSSRVWYEVFARQRTSDFLGHLGSIEAENAELAEARAVRIYDEHAWLEMCIFPRSQCVRVVPGYGRGSEKLGKIGVC